MGWEPLPNRTGPRQLGDALDQVASKLKAPRAHVLKTVFAAWEELVGSVMDDRSPKNLALVGQVLTQAGSLSSSGRFSL